MPAEFALGIVDKCEYATLSLITPDGAPYCVPVTIVRDGNAVYFHSATEGFKTDCMKNDSRVCLVCVGDTKRAEDKFTTEFESAIIRGNVTEVHDDNEKIHALRLLCERHTPKNMAEFDSAIACSLSRTAIWRIDIAEITGKRKKL